MDNENNVAQPDTSGQDVTVEITPLFADDNALRAAYTEALGQGISPDAIVKGWCRIAKLALKTGTHTKTGKINNVSRRVPINAKVYKTVAFRVLENAGMVVPTDADPIVREVSDTDFENWWVSYPSRITNGRPVKKGKVQAKHWFGKKIILRADYDQLVYATKVYQETTNPKYIKDAERFLRHDLWRDYVQTAPTPDVNTINASEVSPTISVPVEIDRDGLNKMMGVVNE